LNEVASVDAASGDAAKNARLKIGKIFRDITQDASLKGSTGTARGQNKCLFSWGSGGWGRHFDPFYLEKACFVSGR
jgi:hypothetical protein